MVRSVLLFILGLLSTAVAVAAISVYVFHDVDRDLAGQLNVAFRGLCTESILFALIVGCLAGIFAFVGMYIFRSTKFPPRTALSVALGVGIVLLQYPWEFTVRKASPQNAQAALSTYLIAAVVLSATVLLCDSVRQKRNQPSPIF